jgi:hypothetical protein
MTWTCEQIEERLSDYVDQLLTAEERSGFVSHAEGCARCGPLVRRMKGLVGELHRLELLETPPLLVEGILAKTSRMAHEEKKLARDWRAWLEWATWRDALQVVAQPRYAMAAVTMVITLSLVSQALGIRWGELSWADLNPANVARSVDRHANLIYARGVKYVNDLWVVYQIQTRLRPEPEATPTQQPQPGKDKTTNNPNPKRELNRANEPGSIPTLVASAIAVLPGRSLR